ncbi:DUF4189 domain-containing protein [Nocardia sp. NBC_00511]|uniref:DUF4189 domain-containing protein n=1 Tax=Nocardia sp. NBC_00511 TaxID=2903591 RepID=UPI0030DFCEC6
MRKIITALAVGTALTALLGTTAAATAPTARADVGWGAIAVSSGGNIGNAWDYNDKYAAENAALGQCGWGDCKVLTSFTGCGAVANSWSAGLYTGGYGPNRGSAENAARQYSDSYIVSSICN